MTLVRHFSRGFGHAIRVDDLWHVYFFDDYDNPVCFSKYAHHHKLLQIIDEDFDYDDYDE
jgi:hypothetical protein